MSDPETTIESTMRKVCDVCKSPDTFNYRLKAAEDGIIDLHDGFKATKKEIFQVIKDNKDAMDEKLDKLNTVLISILTATIVSVILLVLNLIVKTGIR